MQYVLTYSIILLTYLVTRSYISGQIAPENSRWPPWKRYSFFFHLIVPINAINKNVVSYCINKMTTYVSSSYSLSSIMFSYVLAQMHRHCPHPVEQSNPVLLQKQRRVSHPILQLHRTTFSSAFWATSMSHYRARTVVYPLLLSSQYNLWMQMWNKPWFPFPYLHLKVNVEAMVVDSWWWQLVASEEGFQAAQNVYWWLPTGERSATSVYLVCHPLQLCTGILGLLLLRLICHCRTIPACVMKWLSERMCFRGSLFPMLSTQEVESQPRMACSYNILLQTARPSTLCTVLMFQHHGPLFVPDEISGLQKTSQ